MSSEENNLDQHSASLSYSLCSQSCTLIPVSSKPGTIKLSASEADCSCAKGTVSEYPKLCKITCYPKPVTRPIPVSVTPSIELCNCEDMTVPAAPTCESEEEGTHEHKCCATHCCEHNSQGVQPSLSYSDCCNASHSSPAISNTDKPHIEPRLKEHVPRSVEELKASITGLTGLEKTLPPGNLLGCEYIEYRCAIGCEIGCEIGCSSSPCSPTDSQVSIASCPAPRNGFTLTIEPKDHRFCIDPNQCIHSREFCPPEPCPPSSPRPLPPPPPCLPFPPGLTRKPKPPKCPPQPPPPARPPPPPPVCPPPLPPSGSPPPPPECPPPPPPSVCPPPPPSEYPPPPPPECPPPPPPESPPKVCREPPKCPPNPIPPPPCPAPAKKSACPKCRRPPSPPPTPPECPTPPKLPTGNCPGGCDQCNRHRD